MKINGYGKLQIKDIRNLERHVGFKIPDDYRDFLLLYNGGSPAIKDRTISLMDVKQKITVDIFYGMRFNRNSNLVDWYNEYKNDLFEKSFIMGRGQQGFLLLSAHDELPGIYLWDSTFVLPISSEDCNVYKVADSFTHLLDLLQATLDLEEAEAEAIAKAAEDEANKARLQLYNKDGITVVAPPPLEGALPSLVEITDEIENTPVDNTLNNIVAADAETE